MIWSEEKRAKAGKSMRTAREKRGWTQDQIAEKMGITLRQYNKYENGDFPKYKQGVAEKIDEILGTRTRELIYELDVPRAEDVYRLDFLEERSAEYKGKSDPMSIIAELVAINKIHAASNEKNATANEKHADSINNLVRLISETVSSGGNVPASQPSVEEDKFQHDPVEHSDFLDKKEIDLTSKKRKRKGIFSEKDK